MDAYPGCQPLVLVPMPVIRKWDMQLVTRDCRVLAGLWIIIKHGVILKIQY